MLIMTSRRKQIKPIKAHSNQILLPGTFSVSGIVSTSQELQDLQPATETSLVTKEEMTGTLNIKTETEYSGKREEFSEVKPLEKSHSLLTTEGLSDENSRKIHKDDAKILPFETNGGIDYFLCPICNESSICGRENLTCHLQEHQNKTKRDDGKHLCCLCSKELSSNSSLERHLLTHSNHRPFSCVLCDKKFTTNGNLSRHIKTSHNNNGTIDSSIDEVLKKHQLETIGSVTTTEANGAFKFKKAHKSSKKEPVNMELLDLKSCTMNFMTSPVGYLDQSKTDCNTYQHIIQGQNSNINVLSPFYSFNVNELGFIRANLSNNFNILNQNSLSIVTNPITKSMLPTRRSRGRMLRRSNLDSLLPNRLLVALKYRRKISNHIRNIGHIKKFISSSNSINCVKCCRKILSSTNVLAHISQCYRIYQKSHLFCPFKLCSRKTGTLTRLITHIKYTHLDNFYQSIEPVSPPLEPLNLSLKDSSANYPSTVSDNTSESSRYNHKQSKSIASILELSGSNLEMAMSNFQDNSQSYLPFQTLNQFISTPTIVTLSPFQFSTPLTFSSPSSFIGRPSSVPVILNSSTLPGNIQASSWSGKISPFNTINNFTTIANNNDGEISGVSSLTGKYMPGIKKKNSYKDAPKLITCPMDGCAQKFPWNSSLMRHILTHTAHKPFKCTRCIKSFSTKSNRERHMTRVHRVRINRLKFKSLQASRSATEDLSKPTEDGVDSENGNDAASTQDNDARIIELSEEEWIIMDDNDRRAEDISSNLLKLAGQPIVEPNPVRLHNVDRKLDVIKSDTTGRRQSCVANDHYMFLDNNCT